VRPTVDVGSARQRGETAMRMMCTMEAKRRRQRLMHNGREEEKRSVV
jgi:hypothetical protein